MGLISRVSSRTYRKPETELFSKKWPFPRSPNPECQRASPKSDPDSPNRLPKSKKPRSLPRSNPWSNNEKSSPKPEPTPPNTPPKLKLSSTTPKPPRPPATTLLKVKRNSLWSSEFVVSTNCLQNQRRPFNSC